MYGSVALARRRWASRQPGRQRRLTRPVVSVGNLSVGGTGKTPLVGALARWLVDSGERPAILSRGYRRRRPVDGVVVVSDGAVIRAGVDEAGDEPLMLAGDVPGAVVVVGTDRYLSGLVAERRLGCTVHVLDDGFQHVALARDVDVLVTRAGEITGGRVLPAGRLREPREAASAADVLVVADGTPDEARAEADALGIAHAAGMSRRLGAWRWLHGDPGEAAPLAVVAAAGIAFPERFFAALRDAGVEVRRTLAFGDHHAFTRRDVAAMTRAVADVGADALVVTAKDGVKLRAFMPLPCAVAVAPLEIDVRPWSEVTDVIGHALGRRSAK